MEEFKLNLDGAFLYKQEGKVLGMLSVKIEGNVLIAQSTEVEPEARRKGIAGKLFDQMIDYVRQNSLKLISHCSYVDAKLSRKPEEYKALIMESE